MRRIALLTLALFIPSTAWTQEADAKKLAQDILDKGSALYDTQNAAAMAATYTEDAKILWISRSEAGAVQLEVKSGRAEIEDTYHHYFSAATEKTTSRNIVESAQLIAPDLLVIHGSFQPNVNNPGKLPFVQVRVKEGDKWLMKSLQLFVIPGN